MAAMSGKGFVLGIIPLLATRKAKAQFGYKDQIPYSFYYCYLGVGRTRPAPTPIQNLGDPRGAGRIMGPGCKKTRDPTRPI